MKKQMKSFDSLLADLLAKFEPAEQKTGKMVARQPQSRIWLLHGTSLVA